MLDFEEQIESYSPQTNNPPTNSNPYEGINIQQVPDSFNPSVQYKQPSFDAKEPQDNKQEKQAPKGFTRFIHKDYWKQYFKMTEEEVKSRIVATIKPPFKEQFVNQIKPSPDFYGPFWIMTTIIFLMGMVGNFANYITSKFSDEDIWNGYFFKLELVRYAVIFVYSFAVGVPLTLFLMFKFMKCNDLGFPEIACLYGYSMFCFIPALLLCIIPIGVVQWLILCYSFLNSSFFLILSLRKHIQGLPAKSYVIFVVICALQLVFFLVTKYYFIDVDPSVE